MYLLLIPNPPAFFRLQDQLSAATAQKLRRGGEPLAPRPSPKLDAYERHARGRRFFLQLEKGSFDQARQFYEQAIGADSGYAPALAGLAAVHAMRFTFTTDPQELEAAVGYARRAIAADPELAEPRVWLGYALLRQGKFDEGLEQERKAMELDPSAVFAPYFGACCAALPGDYAALVGTGFLDTSRIAGGDPELWTQIFLHNPKFVCEALEPFRDRPTTRPSSRWTCVGCAPGGPPRPIFPPSPRR